MSKKFYTPPPRNGRLVAPELDIHITMLIPVADNIWSHQHAFVVNGVPSTSRMTVVRLNDGSLWVHSPVPITAQIKSQLDRLGPVGHVIAPSLAHHLFVLDFAKHYPTAVLYGTPGLTTKRPDIEGMVTVKTEPGPWAPELQGVLFGGMPKVNETVWFHGASGTLILTDICQCWEGDLSWQAHWWARLSGVRSRFDVPLIVRLLTQDKAAARTSAEAVLHWPIERIVMAHNAVTHLNAKAQLARAFLRYKR